MGLSFLGGMAEGASKELTAQEDRAFKLKLLNRQMELAAEKAKELSDYERNSEEVSAAMGEFSDTKLPVGMRANKADAAAMLGMGKADVLLKASQAKALSRGIDRGLTRKKFNEIYQVQTPGNDEDWLNPTEVIALRDRLRREEPTADQTKTYDTAVKSESMIKSLWDMRNEALKEGGVGPKRGFLTRADRLVSGGKYLPKSTAFINQRESVATLFAKMFGDTGNIAWKEAERAVRSLGDERLSAEAAQIQKDHLDSILASQKEALVKSSPGLRRKIQREQEQTNMKSLTDAHRKGMMDAPSLDLDAIEAQLKAMEEGG